MERAEHGHEFANACGARLPLRLSITNERTGESEDVIVERPWAVIGGGEMCDIRLIHPDVSQRHAYLQFVGNRILCSDLASRTGTHFSTEIRPRIWLKTGQPIYIGPFSIRLAENEFVYDGSAAPTLARGGASSQALPRATLTFVNARSRSGRSRVSRIKRPVTLLGWSQHCNLRLQHATVGRIHCGVVWTEAGLWAVDLLCRGGTRVNGELINAARLDEGDEITVGRFQLRVAYTVPGTSGVEPLSDPAVGRASLAVATRHIPDSMISAIKTSPPRTEIGFPAHGSLLPNVKTPPSPFPGAMANLMEFRPAPLELPQANALTESVALALMQQFSSMQQQLFDHTQQLLSVMAQTFSSAHNRQLDLIRDELFRVHEVNRELQELNLKMTFSEQDPGSAAAPPAIEQAVAPPSAAAPAASVAALSPEAAGPVSAQPMAAPMPSSEEAPAAEPALPAGVTRARGRKFAKKDRAGSDSASPVAPAANAGKPGPDMHAWLSGRINELEEERTSRWQKIMQILAPTSGPN